MKTIAKILKPALPLVLAFSATSSMAVTEGVGVNTENQFFDVPGPVTVTRLEVVSFENIQGNDATALLEDFYAEGVCINYAFDNELSFGYDVTFNVTFTDGNGDLYDTFDVEGFSGGAPLTDPFDGTGRTGGITPPCNPRLPDVNEAPVAVDDIYNADLDGKNVLSNDTDPDGDDLTAQLRESPSNGTVVLNDNGTFDYTPDEGFVGEDQFTYVASDGELESNVATVVVETLAAPNSPPIARNDDFGSDLEGKSVLTNDTDPDGDLLTAILVTQPENGSVELSDDGTFSYTPEPGFSGEDTFTYRARDRALEDPDGLESNIATVTLGSDDSSDGGPITGKEDDDGFSVIEEATENELDTSIRIDQICPRLGSGSEDQNDLLERCTNLRKQGTSARETVVALEAITPEEFSSQRKIGRETSKSQFRNVAARIEGVRRGAAGVSLAGLNLGYGNTRVNGNALDNMLDEAMDQIGGGASADDSISDFGNLGLFVRGDLNFGEQDESELETGYDFDTQSLTFGADYRFTNNFFAGLSGSFGTSDVDFDNDGGDVKTDNYALAVYASWYTKGAAYIDGIASYGWSDIDSKRNIVYEDFGGQVDRTAESNTDGSQYYISVNAGYGFNWDALRFDPMVRLYYMDGSIDSYRENGAEGWDLAFADQDYKSTTLSLGGQLAYTFTPSWGVFTPYIRAEYTREFEDNAEGIVFRFANDPFLGDDDAGTLTVLPEDPDSNYLIYGVGMSAQWPYGISGFVAYSILGSYENLSSETVSVGLRWETNF